jgi:hypothetical protein
MDRGLSLRRRLVGRSPTPILPFAPRSHPLLRFRSHLRPPLGSQSRATIIHPRRRPIGGSNPLSFPRQVASICSSSHRPTTLGTAVHHTAVFLAQVTIDHRAPSSFGPTNRTTSFPVVHCCSSTQSTTLAAICPHRHRPPRRRSSSSLSLGCHGEPLSAKPVLIDSVGHGLGPQQVMHRSPTASRLDFTVEHRRGDRGSTPLFSSTHGTKGLCGLGHFVTGWARFL